VSGAETASLNNVETSNNNSIISAVSLFLQSYQRTWINCRCYFPLYFLLKWEQFLFLGWA